MLVAKGEAAQRRAPGARCAGARSLREYLALVDGPARRRARARSTRRSAATCAAARACRPARTRRGRPAPTSRSSGSPATHTLVRARLETGRTHQIRAHFAAIGHPLAGDREYGARDELGLERQFLHSARLGRSSLPADRRCAPRAGAPALPAGPRECARSDARSCRERSAMEAGRGRRPAPAAVRLLRSRLEVRRECAGRRAPQNEGIRAGLAYTGRSFYPAGTVAALPAASHSARSGPARPPRRLNAQHKKGAPWQT